MIAKILIAICSATITLNLVLIAEGRGNIIVSSLTILCMLILLTLGLMEKEK